MLELRNQQIVVLEIPSLSEGFEELYYVKIKPDNLFLVEAWKNEI